MKPAPKNVNVVCQVCDLPWDKHGPKPTLEKCVELLKAELKTRPQSPRTWYQWNTLPNYSNVIC